jgi:hypothetical protein
MAMMALSVLAPAASALTQSTTDPITTLPVTKIVESRANVSLPSETFTVKMEPADDLTASSLDANNHQVQAGPALASDTLTFTVNSSTDNADGRVELTDSFNLTAFASGAKFTNTGVYRYYITETLPTDTDGTPKTSNGYITFDDTKYTVDLYVEQNSNKEFVVTSYVLHSSKITDDSKPTAVTFTNKISCADVNIYKTVSGNEYVKDQLYEFYVLIPIKGETITLESNQTYVEAYIYNGNTKVIDQGDGNDEGIARTDENGLIKLNIAGATIDSDVTEGTTVYLKAGEHLKIAGAPVSMVYKVAEKDYTSQGYTTTVSYEEVGYYAASTTVANSDPDTYNETREVKGTVNDVTNTVKFLNTRDMTVPGGVSLDFVPYVVILAIAIAGGVLFIVKKRRTAR